MSNLKNEDWYSYTDELEFMLKYYSSFYMQ